MVNAENLHLYLAGKSRTERSSMEDTLVLDGFNVRSFGTAQELWTAFPQTPARIVITERRFAEGLPGLDLAQNIGKQYLMPYVYVVVLSTMNNLRQIKAALTVGVDDYLVRPINRFQLRSRALVGMRWLNYIDSLYEGKTGKQ